MIHGNNNSIDDNDMSDRFGDPLLEDGLGDEGAAVNGHPGVKSGGKPSLDGVTFNEWSKSQMYCGGRLTRNQTMIACFLVTMGFATICLVVGILVGGSAIAEGSIGVAELSIFLFFSETISFSFQFEFVF